MGAPKEVQTPGEFKCELCELSAPYTYNGRTPPNSCLIVHLEEAYVMKYPFTPDKDKFLIVGSRCSLCSRAVCVVHLYHPAQVFYHSALDCSLFYSKRFCLPCVKENLKAFPLEIQEDMDKRKRQQKSCKKNGYKA